MERFDAEIWELTFLRVNIKMMGLFGAWYSTRLPHRVLDNLLAIWVKYLQFSYGISILGFTLYFFKPMEDDIYEYYFTILLIFNIYFNTSEYAMFLFRRPLFAKIIQMMEDYLRFNCQLFGKEEVRQSLAEGNKTAKLLAYSWTSLWIGSIFNYIFNMVFVKGHIVINYKHINATHYITTESELFDHINKLYFFVDEYQTPYYEMTMVLQFSLMTFAIFFFSTLDCMKWSFLITIRSLLLHLNKKMSQLFISKEKDHLNKITINDYIRQHQQILRMYESFGDFMSPIFFILYFRNLVLFVILAFLASKQVSFYVNILIFLSTYLIQFSLFVWFADEITFKSLDTADAIYSSDWLSRISSIEHTGVIMIIHRAQQKIQLNGGPFYTINIPLMIDLVQLSFSTYVFISQMTEDIEN